MLAGLTGGYGAAEAAVAVPTFASQQAWPLLIAELFVLSIPVALKLKRRHLFHYATNGWSTHARPSNSSELFTAETMESVIIVFVS